MECVVHVSALIVLITVLLVFPEEFLLFKVDCPCEYGAEFVRGLAGGLRDWYDEHLLNFRQDNSKVAVLVPSAETLS